MRRRRRSPACTTGGVARIGKATARIRRDATRRNANKIRTRGRAFAAAEESDGGRPGGAIGRVFSSVRRRVEGGGEEPVGRGSRRPIFDKFETSLIFVFVFVRVFVFL